MKVGNPVMLGIVALTLCAIPQAVTAQQQVDKGQLTRVRALLQSSRAELTQQQFLLLGGKLTETEQAYGELVALTEAGAGTATAAEAAGAILGGAAELLPLLIAFWPATAHAPGIKEEKPQIRVARAKLDEKLKELSQAARQVDEEKKKAEQERKRGGCWCVCVGKNLMQGGKSVQNAAECQKYCDESPWRGTKGLCK